MTDERDPASLGCARQLHHHVLRCVPGGQGGEQFHGRLACDIRGEQIRGLLGAYERTREDLVERHIEPRQPGQAIFETGDPFFGERSYVVVWPLWPTFGGYRVADDVQFTRGHGRVYAAEAGCRSSEVVT